MNTDSGVCGGALTFVTADKNVIPYTLEADSVCSCMETGVVCLCPTYQALLVVGLLCQVVSYL